MPVSSLPHISTNQNHSSVISFMLQAGKEEHLLANETAMQLGKCGPFSMQCVVGNIRLKCIIEDKVWPGVCSSAIWRTF